MVRKVKRATPTVRMTSQKRLNSGFKSISVDEQTRLKLQKKIERAAEAVQKYSGDDPWTVIRRRNASLAKFKLGLDLSKLESKMAEKAKKLEEKIAKNISLLQMRKAV